MTTIAKADELATLRASLDVERAQNETLHAELAARRDQRILACEALSRATLLLVAAATWGSEQTLGKLGRTVRREDVEHTALSLVRDVAELLRLDPGDDLAHVLGKMLGDADRERFASREAPTQPEGRDVTNSSPPGGLSLSERRAMLGIPDAPSEDEIGRALAEQCTCGGIAGGRACASTCAIFKESHPVCGAEPKQDGSDGPDFRPCTLPRGHEGPHSRNRLMPLHGRPIARREGTRKP